MLAAAKTQKWVGDLIGSPLSKSAGAEVSQKNMTISEHP
jgi:hypothetical protein